MREIVFRVTADRPGHLEATAPQPLLTVSAPSREEWHHEARDVLIRELGSAHVTYRIRLRHGRSSGGAAGADRISPGRGGNTAPRVQE
jgi:hypothetical protein